MATRRHETGDLIDRLVADWARERPDLDTSSMALIGRLILVGRAIESRTSEVLRASGLNYSEFDVLATLRRSGKPYELMPKQLMDAVLITSGAMSALLDRLERKAFITRGLSERDGRVRTAQLTHAGFDLIEKAVTVRFADADAIASMLPTARHEGLTTALQELLSALDAALLLEIAA
jgi:DNA-binding MarR family transcriptional regulator